MKVVVRFSPWSRSGGHGYGRRLGDGGATAADREPKQQDPNTAAPMGTALAYVRTGNRKRRLLLHAMMVISDPLADQPKGKQLATAVY